MVTDKLSIRTLIIRLKMGDASVIEEIYRLTSDDLSRFAWWMTRDEKLARKLTYRTYVEMVRCAKDLDEEVDPVLMGKQIMYRLGAGRQMAAGA